MVRDLGSKAGGNSRQSRVPFRMKSGPGPRWVGWPSTAREQEEAGREDCQALSLFHPPGKAALAMQGPSSENSGG